MNKNVTPSASSIAASVWFAEYLQKKLETGKTGGPRAESAVKLAQAVGLDRKTIYDYAHLRRSPKLEVVAKILAFYGETSINIPLTDKPVKITEPEPEHPGRCEIFLNL